MSSEILLCILNTSRSKQGRPPCHSRSYVRGLDWIERFAMPRILHLPSELNLRRSLRSAISISCRMPSIVAMVEYLLLLTYQQLACCKDANLTSILERNTRSLPSGSTFLWSFQRSCMSACQSYVVRNSALTSLLPLTGVDDDDGSSALAPPLKIDFGRPTNDDGEPAEYPLPPGPVVGSDTWHADVSPLHPLCRLMARR
jgi:hypothetical protein